MHDESKICQKKWDALYSEKVLQRNYRSDPTIQKNDQFISKYSSFYNKGIFVDLGCGVAWNSALLAEKGVTVLGIDVSYQSVYRSQELFSKQNLSGCFIQADFSHLPIQTESISFIFAGMSLEYVKDTVGAMKEAYRVLKPGSRMVTTFPVLSLTTLTYQQLRGDIPNIFLFKNITEWLHIHLLKGKYMKYGYGQTFSINYIKKSFKDAGFDMLDFGYYKTHYPVKFVPKRIRPLIQNMLKFRPFWPVTYFEVIKPIH